MSSAGTATGKGKPKKKSAAEERSPGPWKGLVYRCVAYAAEMLVQRGYHLIQVAETKFTPPSSVAESFLMRISIYDLRMFSSDLGRTDVGEEEKELFSSGKIRSMAEESAQGILVRSARNIAESIFKWVLEHCSGNDVEKKMKEWMNVYSMGCISYPIAGTSLLRCWIWNACKQESESLGNSVLSSLPVVVAKAPPMENREWGSTIRALGPDIVPPLETCWVSLHVDSYGKSSSARSSLAMSLVREFINYCSKLKRSQRPNRVVLISPKGTTAKGLVPLRDVGISCESWLCEKICVNLSRHQLFPQTRVLTEKETEFQEKKYGVERTKWPLVLMGDPMQRFFGLHPGTNIVCEVGGGGCAVQEEVFRIPHPNDTTHEMNQHHNDLKKR